MPSLKAVAILDTMWGNYDSDRSPAYFRINPDNKTGRVLYQWLGDRFRLVVTNACAQLVSHAAKHGTPHPERLQANLARLHPIDLLLVCGNVAQRTYQPTWAGKARIVEVPHPAARMWTRQALAFAGEMIRDCELDLDLHFRDGRLVATHLVPF